MGKLLLVSHCTTVGGSATLVPKSPVSDVRQELREWEMEIGSVPGARVICTSFDRLMAQSDRMLMDFRSSFFRVHVFFFSA